MYYYYVHTCMSCMSCMYTAMTMHTVTTTRSSTIVHIYFATRLYVYVATLGARVGYTILF